MDNSASHLTIVLEHVGQFENHCVKMVQVHGLTSVLRHDRAGSTHFSRASISAGGGSCAWGRGSRGWARDRSHSGRVGRIVVVLEEIGERCGTSVVAIRVSSCVIANQRHLSLTKSALELRSG